MPLGAHHGNIDKLAAPHARGGPTEAAIVAEIATRLIEWRTSPGILTESKPFKWLQRTAALGRDNPDALWLYLNLQTGDLSALTDTYQSQAKTDCKGPVKYLHHLHLQCVRITDVK